MKYEAFISYRHREIDEVVAKHIQKIIERYRVPTKIAKTIGKTHVGKVFRDSDELQAASNLSEIIRTGIENSKWLIVICTKRYKDSVWCMEEIEHFIELNGREKVIVILVEGEPNESFPSILTEIEVDGETKHIEPLAVDIRGDSEKAIIKNLNNEQFRFLSTILQVDYDDLKNRQRERRLKRIATAATAAFAILATITGLIIKNNIDLYNSNQKTLRGESYFLSEYADAAYNDGDRDTAIKLALMALPKDLGDPDRPYVPNAMQALTKALEIYDFTPGYHIGYSRTWKQNSSDLGAVSSLCEDGSIMLIQKFMLENANDISLKREAEVLRVSDGKSLYKCNIEDSVQSESYTRVNGAALSKDGNKLYYLNENGGLVCVDINTGNECFSLKDIVFDMRMDPDAEPGKTAIVTMDYSDNLLYGYDFDGNKTLSLDFSGDLPCHLGEIDHATGKMTVETSREVSGKKIMGFYVIDINTGETMFHQVDVSVGYPVIFGKDSVLYFSDDENSDKTVVVQYNMKDNNERRMLEFEGSAYGMALTEGGRCFYYRDNTIYEYDCSNNKILWEEKVTSTVTSICAKDGVVAVGLENGSVYVFEENSKNKIKTPSGGGESVRVSDISKNAFTTADGRNVSVYIERKPENDTETPKVSIADIGGGFIPTGWFGNYTESNRFLFGLKSGTETWVAEYDSDTMEKITERDFSEYTSGYSPLFEQQTSDYIYLTSDGYIDHFDAASMKKVYETETENTHLFYSDDKTVIYETKGSKLNVIAAATGEPLGELDLPEGCQFAAFIGETLLMQYNWGITVFYGDDKPQEMIEDAVLYSINERRGLILCHNLALDTWRIYNTDLELVFEAPLSSTGDITIFGNNRYIMLNMSEVYDMDTWEKVLTINPEYGIVNEASTTDDCPYFVIVGSSYESNAFGNRRACLYEKNGNGDPAAVIDNYVAMTPDGSIIVYDGDKTLYKTPILSPEQVKQKAEQMTGGAELTPEQKEKYHIFR